ncbi:MAG: IS1634 family transposase [Peptococcaceae bacterium]|nr:IS1634 family transposase [Peptococcaceae bacterium]
MRLQKKRVRGYTYWYLVESKRVDGKPRTVWQHYLGKAEDIWARLANPSTAGDVVVAEFGAMAALLSIATRLGLEEIIDSVAQKRHQGVGVGKYLLLAAINRVVAPKSKTQIGSWYEKTFLRRLWGISKSFFSSQQFWRAMDRVDEKALVAIEDAVTAAAITEFGVKVQALAYDATNFFSYIGTPNPAELPQRGHNKQKRNDLRQINLALLSSTDGHVPLMHTVYPGNVPDPTAFGQALGRLEERYHSLAAFTDEGITVVFDKGNPSKENMTSVFGAELSFVSSLVPSYNKELLEIPWSEYSDVDSERFPGLTAYTTNRKVYGRECRIVVTYNPALWVGQARGFRHQQKQIERGLEVVQTRLARWREKPTPRGRRPTPATVERVIKRLGRGREAGAYLRWEFTLEEGGNLHLITTWDEDAIGRLLEQQFGKTILFSDHTDWDASKIVAAYRGQGTLENAFRQMKDPHFVTFRPVFHWTDQKIRVHSAYCVLALLLASLLHREARAAGFTGDFDALMETLNDIRMVVDLPEKGRRKPVNVRLTRRTPEQDRLFQQLGLIAYQPKPESGAATQP